MLVSLICSFIDLLSIACCFIYKYLDLIVSIIICYLPSDIYDDDLFFLLHLKKRRSQIFSYVECYLSPGHQGAGTSLLRHQSPLPFITMLTHRVVEEAWRTGKLLNLRRLSYVTKRNFVE